jgi:plasmid stabilization system protein ParE
MDSYKVNITKQAEESMRDIALYIARNLMNVSAAVEHVDAMQTSSDPSRIVFLKRLTLLLRGSF